MKGPGCVYPGVMGGVETVGLGTTYRLANMCVMPAGIIPSSTRTGTEVPRPTVLDMSGPGSLPGIRDNYVLALVIQLRPGYTDLDYHNAIQMAEMKIAHRLAEATVGKSPESIKVYELGTVADSLPKVVFIQGLLTTADSSHSGNCYYGWPIREMLTLWAHPNEFLDGAMTVKAGGMSSFKPSTWDWLHHPVIARQYELHGKEINFLGVLLQRIRFTTHQRKELAAQQAAKIAHSYGAQGAIITWEVAGNAFIDTMLTTAACEKLGIKAVLMTYEGGGRAGEDPPLLYSVPEAVSVVSTGSTDVARELPSVKRVIGPQEVPLTSAPGAPRLPAKGPLAWVNGEEAFMGAVDIWGKDHRTCREF